MDSNGEEREREMRNNRYYYEERMKLGLKQEVKKSSQLRAFLKATPGPDF